MRTVLLVTMAVLVLMAGCLGGPGGGGDGNGASVSGDGNGYGNGNGNGNGASAASDEQVGYSVGGASDMNNFRDNVQEGYLPLATDVVSEGVYKEYYFDRGADEPCTELFCPSYSQAVSADPLSGEREQYLTVGLNSGLTKSTLERDDLNLVVVVDESSSMSSPFDSYYYDADGERVETDQREKMSAAKDAVGTLLDQLRPEDRVGLVSFSDNANVVASMDRVGERDMSDVRDSVQQLRADGGTNLDAGMRRAELMAREYAADSDRETRIIYVTDAMPNLGGTGTGTLGGRLSDHAQDGLYSTFVGVGVDFNTELVTGITDTRGANYYSVQSADQFQQRMDEGFDYMVNPLVFDLSLTVEAEGYEISQVYGTPADSALDGDIMHVKTLFPSKTDGNRTKGGVILLELADTGPGDRIEVTTSYETGAGERHENTETVRFEAHEPEQFDNTGIRKAVALARYAELSQNWIAYERATLEGGDPDEPGSGIDNSENPYLGQWERQSTDLQVSSVYAERFAEFATYFERELQAVGDDAMKQDLAIVELLADAGAETDDDTTDGDDAASLAGPPMQQVS